MFLRFNTRGRNATGPVVRDGAARDGPKARSTFGGFRPIRELMSSINSVNSGVGDLLQTFSSGSTSLSQALSAPGVQSALQNAPAADLVQLSQQALQLQQVGGLFGNSDISQASASPATLFLQALINPSQSSQPASSSSAANSYAATAGSFAQLEASDLFGSNSANISVILLG